MGSRGGGSGGRRSGGGGSVGGSRSGGGRRNSSATGSRGGYRSSPTTRTRSSGYRPTGHYHSTGWYYPRRSHSPWGPWHLAGMMWRIVVPLVVLIVIFAVVLPVFFSSRDKNITKSTIQREKLPAEYVSETDYFYDNMEDPWVNSPQKLEQGLKQFYKETGVQPYLYLTDTIDGSSAPTDEQMAAFAEQLYDSTFKDEGHLLVIFQEYHGDGRYFVYCLAGKQAKGVFDNEAREILFDYIDAYYYSDLNTEEFFSTAFTKTAERMMAVTKETNPVIIIAILMSAVAVAVIAFKWWKARKKQKNIEAEHMERVLKTDLNEIKTDSTIQDLENKYE